MLFARFFKAIFDVLAFFVVFGVVLSIVSVLVVVVKDALGW